MEFQKAGEAQIERLAALYADARAAIAAFSIDQWQDGYPRVSDIENDIRRDELWIGMTGERIDCAAALLASPVKPVWSIPTTGSRTAHG